MDGSGNSVKLTRRWMIKGTLTTTSPLHVGSGNFEADVSRLKKKDKNEAAEFAAVARNYAGKPYVPGSTLKGVLRSWASGSGKDSTFIEQIFGTRNANDDESVGGKADFFDLHATECNGISHEPPHWKADKWTGIIASTQINRRTRTVSDGMLFHTEYVPSGVTFEVRIGGQDTIVGSSTDGEPNYDQIAQLIALFDGFSKKKVALGSDTGNGWGQFDWKLDTVYVFDPTIAKKWDPTTSVGYSALQPVDNDTKDAIATKVAEIVKAAGTNAKLQIGVSLQFEGSFLVNDPSRAKQGKDRNDQRPNHAPLLDEKGMPWLPARSFRGAFRSQAERILRTIAGDKAACYPDTNPCGPVHETKDIYDLCLACQLFGATGWKAPIQFTSFKPALDTEKGTAMRQEFVAIDRFTGGSAEGAKFNADSFYRPKMRGTVSIDANALDRTACPDALRGLLVLTLRDLMEGDIRFGFGSAKGYGVCTADFTSISGSYGISAPTGFMEHMKAFLVDQNAADDTTDLKGAIQSLHDHLSGAASSDTEAEQSGD